MNLILLEPADFIRDDIAVLAGRRAKHIREVLKAGVGKILRIGRLDGPKGEGTVLETTEERVTLECRFAAESPAPSGLSLLLALPRPKVMKRLWSVLASFGLDEILVTSAARVDRCYFETQWLAPDRYAPLLREGLEQAGFTRLPRVKIVRRLKPLIESDMATRAPETLLLRAVPGAETRLTALSLESGRPVLLAIGPEGGWSESENSLFAHHGFRDVSLGAGTLRSDTACVAALGVLACLKA